MISIVFTLLVVHLLASDALFLVLQRLLRGAERPSSLRIFLLTRGLGPAAVAVATYTAVVFLPGRSSGFYFTLLGIAFLVPATFAASELSELFQCYLTSWQHVAKGFRRANLLVIVTTLLALSGVILGVGLPLVEHDGLAAAMESRIALRDNDFANYLAIEEPDPETGYYMETFRPPFLQSLYVFYGWLGGMENLDLLIRTTSPIFGIHCLLLLAVVVRRHHSARAAAWSVFLLVVTPIFFYMTYNNGIDTVRLYLSFVALLWMVELAVTGSLWVAVAAGGASGLALFCHLLSAPLLTGGGLAFLVFGEPRLTRRITAAAVLAAVSLVTGASFHYFMAPRVLDKVEQSFGSEGLYELAQVLPIKKTHEADAESDWDSPGTEERSDAADEALGAVSATEVQEGEAEQAPTAGSPRTQPIETGPVETESARRPQDEMGLDSEERIGKGTTRNAGLPPDAPDTGARTDHRSDRPKGSDSSSREEPEKQSEAATEASTEAPKKELIPLGGTPADKEPAEDQAETTQGVETEEKPPHAADTEHPELAVDRHAELLRLRGQGQTPIQQLVFGRLQMFTGIEYFGWLFYLFWAGAVLYFVRGTPGKLERILIVSALVAAFVVLSGIRQLSWSNPRYVATLLLVAAYFAGPLMAAAEQRFLRARWRRWATVAFLVVPVTLVTSIRGAKVEITNPGTFYSHFRSLRWVDYTREHPAEALSVFANKYLGIRKTVRYFLAEPDEQLRHAHDYFAAVLWIRDNLPEDAQVMVFRDARYFYYSGHRGTVWYSPVIHQRAYRFMPSPEALQRYLRGLGIRYVLVDDYSTGLPGFADRWTGEMLADKALAETIYEFGTARVYRLPGPPVGPVEAQMP